MFSPPSALSPSHLQREDTKRVEKKERTWENMKEKTNRRRKEEKGGKEKHERTWKLKNEGQKLLKEVEKERKRREN